MRVGSGWAGKDITSVHLLPPLVVTEGIKAAAHKGQVRQDLNRKKPGKEEVNQVPRNEPTKKSLLLCTLRQFVPHRIASCPDT